VRSKKARSFAEVWIATTLGGLCITHASNAAAAGQGGVDDMFRVDVTPQASPPAITLRWDFPAPDSASLYRRVLSANASPPFAWVAPIPKGALSFTDYPSKGVAYEYRIIMGPERSPVVAAGIELGPIERRGKVLLLVDETLAAPAAAELGLLERDLVGDGWRVVRRNVPRDDGRYLTRLQAQALKNQIIAEYNSDPANVKAVLLVGHVPVPYCGWSAPDGHFFRALPCDGYYGDIDGTFTDSSINQPSASNGERGRNIPGDGKFDQNAFPSDIDLSVGRIDVANMPAFGDPEVVLLKRYLAKAHAWRHRRFRVDSNSLVNWTRPYHWGDFNTAYNLTDNVYTFANARLYSLNGNDLPGADADYMRLLSRRSNLFAFTGSTGANDAAGGVTTAQIAARNILAPFTFEGGSYSVDWDQRNNLMRAFVAASGYALSGGWSEFPSWYLHHMGAGATLGFSARANQNNEGLYFDLFGRARAFFLALHGDPTLRMFNVAPPSQLNATASGNGVALAWTASADAPVGGYLVYRAPSIFGEFTRLTDAPVTGTTYTDTIPRTGDVVYMVRAVKLQRSPTASFWNLSEGAFVPVRSNGTPNRLPTATSKAISGGASMAVTLEGSDPDNDSLVYVVNETTINGRLSGSPPNLTYTAYDGNAGNDRFTYTVHDAWGASLPATVDLTMAPAVLVRGPQMPGYATSLPFLRLPEGGTVTFQVKLSARPESDTTVAVTPSTANPDVTIQAGASLVFTPTNWNIEQSVTLRAADDDDQSSDSAALACSAPGFAPANVSVSVEENDMSLRVFTSPGGTVSPAGATRITKGVPTAISATPANGFVFSHWVFSKTVTDASDSRVARARFANPFAAATTLTADMGGPWDQAGVTATATFFPVASAVPLTVSAGPGGSVFPTGTINVAKNSTDIAVSAASAAGNTFSRWTVVTGPATFTADTSATTALRTLSAASTVRAEFLAVPDSPSDDGGVPMREWDSGASDPYDVTPLPTDNAPDSGSASDAAAPDPNSDSGVTPGATDAGTDAGFGFGGGIAPSDDEGADGCACHIARPKQRATPLVWAMVGWLALSRWRRRR